MGIMLFLYFVLIGVGVTYVVTRSPIGQRNSTQERPSWAEKIGDKDTPKIVSSDFFLELAWLARRLIPLAATFLALSITRYIDGGHETFGFTSADWIAIFGLVLALFVAGAPFAKKPRRGPLDKWVVFVHAFIFVLIGIIFAVIQAIITLVRPDLTGDSLISSMARWTEAHPLNETLGWSFSVIALGVTLLALIEGMPNWRTGKLSSDSDKSLCDSCGQKLYKAKGGHSDAYGNPLPRRHSSRSKQGQKKRKKKHKWNKAR